LEGIVVDRTLKFEITTKIRVNMRNRDLNRIYAYAAVSTLIYYDKLFFSVYMKNCLFMNLKLAMRFVGKVEMA